MQTAAGAFFQPAARLAAAAHGCRDKSPTDELAACRGEDRRHFIGVWRPAMDCHGHAEDDARSSSRQSRVVRELSLVSPPALPPPRHHSSATTAAPMSELLSLRARQLAASGLAARRCCQCHRSSRPALPSVSLTCRARALAGRQQLCQGACAPPLPAASCHHYCPPRTLHRSALRGYGESGCTRSPRKGGACVPCLPAPSFSRRLGPVLDRGHGRGPPSRRERWASVDFCIHQLRFQPAAAPHR